jgi:D-alanyl-lipoteichoic acid acyltransferase DltB (MBOAT superfamily)
VGGSRKGFIFTQVNLLIAMGLSGAWHGIGWNFLLWGLLHGIALVFLNIGDKSISAISHKKDTRNFISSTGYFGKVFSNFLTIQFVCFSFILFRTKNLGDANIILSSLVNNLHDIPSLTHSVPLLVTMILSWIFYPFIQKMPLALNATLLRTPWPLRWILVLLIFLLIILISPSGIPGFLYANF